MEERLIAGIRAQVAAEKRFGKKLVLGPGDDGAILTRPEGHFVVTTDMLSDGVDFLAAQVEPARIGRKAIAVNLSDLAAMAARPHSVVVSILLPRRFDAEFSATAGENAPNVATWGARLAYGMFPILRRYDAALAGGDVNSWDGKIAISVTAMGTVEPDQAFRRAGAKPGDRILVTGAFGGSIFGHHFDFSPRVKESLFLSRFYRIDAAIDVSDGLLLDLSRLARESGVGFWLDESKIPISAAAKVSRNGRFGSGKPSPLDAALTDGEDFELILAVPPKEAARLVAEQPFEKLAQGGRSVASEKMKKLCRELDLPWGPDDRAEGVRLTDIGEFVPAEEGFRRTDAAGRGGLIGEISGWTHQFE